MRISDWSSDVCSSDLKRRIMGDDDQRRVIDGSPGEQQVDDRAARPAVKIAGRLVSEQYVGHRRDRAGNGNALLLAPGKLRRIMMQPMTQTHRFKFRRG